MSPDKRLPESDPLAASHPDFRRLVESIRELPPPPPRRDADALHAAFLVARQARRRRVTAYVGVALAAALALLALTRLDLGLSKGTGTEDPVAEDMRLAPAATQVASATTPATATPAPATPAALALSPAARVIADDASTPSPTVLGPWEVALAPGRYSAEVDEHASGAPLRLRAPDGALELHHGRFVMIVGAARTEVELLHGVGVWVAKDGRRVELGPAEPELADPLSPPGGPAAPDVSAMARHAEALLSAGKRDAAIKQLSQIVTAHPQHPAARAALLDLAPLLAAAGRVDEARCAYHLYLARYPGKQLLADQVEKALARLGEGRSCRGLKPAATAP